MSVVVPIERDPHAAAQALLPWYARGQLDDDETRELQAHLQGCARCQAELAAEPALRALCSQAQAEPPAASVEAGLARMRARIRAAQPPRIAPPPSRLARWLGWTLGLQGVAVASLLVVLVWPRSEPAPAYRALATPEAALTAHALIMFGPEASERQLRAALARAGARLAGGPTETGAYLLRLPDGDHAGAIERLRAQPGVSLVQSLEAGPAR